MVLDEERPSSREQHALLHSASATLAARAQLAHRMCKIVGSTSLQRPCELLQGLPDSRVWLLAREWVHGTR